MSWMSGWRAAQNYQDQSSGCRWGPWDEGPDSSTVSLKEERTRSSGACWNISWVRFECYISIGIRIGVTDLHAGGLVITETTNTPLLLENPNTVAGLEEIYPVQSRKSLCSFTMYFSEAKIFNLVGIFIATTNRVEVGPWADMVYGDWRAIGNDVLRSLQTEVSRGTLPCNVVVGFRGWWSNSIFFTSVIWMHDLSNKFTALLSWHLKMRFYNGLRRAVELAAWTNWPKRIYEKAYCFISPPKILSIYS